MKLRHQLFGTERGFIELAEMNEQKINNNNLSARQKNSQTIYVSGSARRATIPIRDTKLKRHRDIKITFVCVLTPVPKNLNKFPGNSGRESPRSPSSTKGVTSKQMRLTNPSGLQPVTQNRNKLTLKNWSQPT